jgi:putative methionine-R-sulfoxide reductase with GAF domain
MHNIKKYRRYTILSYILFVVILILLSVSIWNAAIHEEQSLNIGLLFFYLVLILLIFTVKFIISYRLSDKNKIDLSIKRIVDEERAKLIASYKKKTIKEEEISDTKIDVDKSVKKILQNTRNLKNLKSFTEKLFANLSKELEIVQGIFYIKVKKTNRFSAAGEYAYTGDKKPDSFKLGETLPGQAAKSKNIIIIDDIPEEYLNAESGLGKSMPKYLILVPIVNKGKPVAVMELASFKNVDESGKNILKELSTIMGEKIDKFIN